GSSRCGKSVRQAHARPEPTHATGDTISIVVQFGVGLESDDFCRRRRAAKSLKIQFLPAGDDVQYLADEFLVDRGLRLQEREAGFAFLQQDAFGRRALMLSEFAKTQRLRTGSQIRSRSACNIFNRCSM